MINPLGEASMARPLTSRSRKSTNLDRDVDARQQHALVGQVTAVVKNLDSKFFSLEAQVEEQGDALEGLETKLDGLHAKLDALLEHVKSASSGSHSGPGSSN